jgi:hypothetical protein
MCSCVFRATTDDEALVDFLHHGIGIAFDELGQPVPDMEHDHADLQVGASLYLAEAVDKAAAAADAALLRHLAAF